MTLFHNLFGSLGGGNGSGLSNASSWPRVVAQFLLTPNPTNVTRMEAQAYTAAPPRHEPRRKQQARNDSTKEETLAELLIQLTVSVGLAVVCGLIAQTIMRSINGAFLEDGKDPNTPPSNQITARLQAILQKRANAAAAADDKDQKKKKKKVPRVATPQLTTYELQMAANILDPDDIESSFSNIGGLDKTKEELYALAILPLLEPQLFSGSALVQPCKGILLYGPPGTGKTLLAKALAKEAAAVFLPLPLSTILNKWVGESNKLVAATFSLAHKLAPAIIFIDELDTFLKANTQETAYLDTIKSEFLTWWDGVSTQSAAQVLVLGATNRPQHIDSAILRRMPRAFLVPLPDVTGRLAILKLLLQDENTTPDVATSLPALAKQTDGYSGSDLKEMCKTAAMVRIQERTHAFSMARMRGETASLQAARKTPLRPLCAQDLQLARSKVRKTGQAAQEYGRESSLQSLAQRAPAAAAPQINVQDLAALLRQFSDLSFRDEPLRRSQEAKSEEDDQEEEEQDKIPEMPE